MEKMVKLKINEIEVEVPEGTSVLDAAKQVQIKIPTLCYHEDLKATAACGLCVVKTKGSPKTFRACATTVAEGMDVITHDSELFKIRKTVLELILSTHPDDCLQCQRNGNCELQRLAAEFGIRDANFKKMIKQLPKDQSTPSLVFDPQKCIGCGRCVEVCQEMQNVWALEFIGRGFDTYVGAAGADSVNESPCVKCGQCSAHCPVGAIVEKDNTGDVWDALRSEDLHQVVQIAPAVRVAFMEGFGGKSGEISTKKIYALLKRLGFKAVFDTNFSADLTIMEEGTEFVKRFTEDPTSLPLVTSCCPSWVDYMEKYFPDMISHFSTAKSPQQMLSAMAKTYYPERTGIDCNKVHVTSVMPCTAKKYEISRDDNMSSCDTCGSSVQDTDLVLTTRELVRMAKSSGIDFEALPDEEPDLIMGEYTGAGTIFGVTGGVMEAALRSAYFLITKEELGNVDLVDVRGMDGVKEAEVDIKGTKVRVAVAHGLKNVDFVMNKIKTAKENGEEMPWHFVEVMACRGGCIGGGGQPYGVTDAVRKLRTKGLYSDDKQHEIRCSHQNPYITKIYEDYLGEPGSHKAHKFLHTDYQERKLYHK